MCITYYQFKEKEECIAIYRPKCYSVVKMTNILPCCGGADMQVSVLEAKTNLSNLVKLVESGKEDQIIIARTLGSDLITLTHWVSNSCIKNRIWGQTPFRKY